MRYAPPHLHPCPPVHFFRSGRPGRLGRECGRAYREGGIVSEKAEKIDDEAKRRETYDRNWLIAAPIAAILLVLIGGYMYGLIGVIVALLIVILSVLTQRR